MKLIPRRTGLLAALALAAAAALTPAQAQQVTLKAVNGFQEGTYYARNFEAFVKKVNEEGKGLVQINYLGVGPQTTGSLPTDSSSARVRSSAAGVVPGWVDSSTTGIR